MLAITAGTQVAVYGVTPVDSNATSLYTIDSGEPVSFTPRKATIVSTTRILYFKSQELSYGEHTLRITVTEVSTTDSFTIDWIQYNTTSLEQVASMSSMAGISRSSTIAYPAGSPAPLTSAPSPSSSYKPPASISGVRVAEIMAAVLGTIVFIMLSSILYCYWRRQRRGRYRNWTHAASGEYILMFDVEERLGFDAAGSSMTCTLRTDSYIV